MSPTTCWAAVVLIGAATFLARGAGPAAAGEADLPPAAGRVVALLGPALLAALVVTQALADGPAWALRADTAGVAAAALLVLRGAPVLLVVVAAAAVAALVRLGGVP